MSATEMNPTEVLIPSARLAYDPLTRQYSVGERTLSRVQAFMNYYLHHEQAFQTNDDAFVLCAGGYSGQANQESATDDGRRPESLILGEALKERGVEEALLRYETRSRSSKGNIGYAVREKLLRPQRYNPDHPLAIVAPLLYCRRLLPILQVVGIQPESVRVILADERENRLREAAAKIVTERGLRNARNEDDLIELDDNRPRLRWGIKA